GKRSRYALERLDVDDSGFDGLDRLLVRTLLEKFDGGPVGIETLAAAVGEDSGTLEDVVEPYLIHRGFLSRTSRGRVATRLARDYFEIPLPDGVGSQQKLL
ncbi:MAG: Holliday junction DNA helicase RuvB C-terminal domain-containing protein, partial [Myxococcota bacterium]